MPKLHFDSGEIAEMQPSPDMFGNVASIPVKQRFNWHPRLYFADDAGHHNLMLRDWGCYEFLRKQGDERRLLLEEALNLETAPPLFCGNLGKFRNVWLVISVLSGAIHARPHIFDQKTLL